MRAVIEAVNKLSGALFPSLHHRKEGKAASSKRFRAATEADAAGVVFLLFSIGEPPRPRCQRKLRDILLIAQPPLIGDARRGIMVFPIRSHLHRPRLQLPSSSFFT